MPRARRGADRVIETLARGGVDVCFTNPGTTEMHLVAAFDRMGGVRPVLGLFEGVVAGAADGYARMAERPAATLLHTGPGLANGLANFHNARKAHSPIVSLVGDHAQHHSRYDAPLSADVEAIARPVSRWVRRTSAARDLGADVAEAMTAAVAPPGGVATLVIPANCAWEAAGPAGRSEPPPRPEVVAPARVLQCAAVLRSEGPAAMLLAGPALRGEALLSAGRIVGATGAALFCPTFATRRQRGAGRVEVEALPFFAEDAVAMLSPFRYLVLAGADTPVAFFGYPDVPSLLVPEGCAVHPLARPDQDVTAALVDLCDALGARLKQPTLTPRVDTGSPSGALTADSVHHSLAALLPEGAIVSDEGITGSFGRLGLTRGAAPHDWLQLMGGALGQGLPVATGAALACPDRKVVCLEADGSALYTIQALWTQAREGLDVTTVILANRRYAVLETELVRVGATAGPLAHDQYALDRPILDFVRMAEGFGVPATRAEDAASFHRALAAALAAPGPQLIEAVIQEP